jgi:cell division protein FtsA
VLTGGTAKMEGAVEFAEEIFQMPVRIASPLAVKGLKEYVDDPCYSTVVGLLHYGMQANQSGAKESQKSEGVTGLWTRLHAWFKGEF